MRSLPHAFVHICKSSCALEVEQTKRKRERERKNSNSCRGVYGCADWLLIIARKMQRCIVVPEEPRRFGMPRVGRSLVAFLRLRLSFFHTSPPQRKEEEKESKIPQTHSSTCSLLAALWNTNQGLKSDIHRPIGQSTMGRLPAPTARNGENNGKKKTDGKEAWRRCANPRNIPLLSCSSSDLPRIEKPPQPLYCANMIPHRHRCHLRGRHLCNLLMPDHFFFSSLPQ